VVQQLGIPAGIPVITKVDTVEREWAEMVALEVNEWLSDGPGRLRFPGTRFGNPW
jgi:translation elongation factor EF-Tu-like GTPase